MTPKEKANEMYLKFRDTNGVVGAAKQCTIIAVEEIIKSHIQTYQIEWWEKVLIEVHKFYTLK